MQTELNYKYNELLFFNSLKTYLEVGLFQGITLCNLLSFKDVFKRVQEQHDLLLEEVKQMPGARDKYPELFQVQGIEGA